MSKFMNPTDPCPKSKYKKAKNPPNHPACQHSRWAAIDVLILIAVIGSLVFLLFPHIKLLTFHTIEIVRALVSAVGDEFSEDPVIYGCLGLSFVSAVIAVLAVTVSLSRKCGKPGCRGRMNAGEFDIQIETEEECVKNSSSSSSLGEDGLKKGVLVLKCDHHGELESELKKMAPVNGRAILLFRARCGCSVGRMELPGPKKQPRRKIKKQ